MSVPIDVIEEVARGATVVEETLQALASIECLRRAREIESQVGTHDDPPTASYVKDDEGQLGDSSELHTGRWGRQKHCRGRIGTQESIPPHCC